MDELLAARLIEACRSNDVAVIEAEFASGKDLNVTTKCNESTLLYHAALHESLDVVKWLLKHQPQMDRKSHCREYTPLLYACAFHKEVDCILELIAAGCYAKINPITALIENSCMQWEKKKTLIEVFLQNGVDIEKPEVLLQVFISAYDGTEESLEILHLLLYYNIDVNANGAEPLTFALKYGHFDIFDILWDYIADFTLNSDGLLIESLKRGYRFNELIEKDLDIYDVNNFEISDALFALCTSSDANAIERLNYLCMRFQSSDETDTLIECMATCLNDLFRPSDAINKECVIRLLHLLFNFAFESKIDLFHFIYWDEFYKLLNDIELDKDGLIQMCYLYLMSTSRISFFQLYRIYKNCSKDLFEIFLKVTVKIDYSIVSRQPAHHERNVYIKFISILYPDLLPPDMEDEKVPSLLKLSRNAIRKRFQPDHKTMRRQDLVFFRYYNEINKLDVPKRVKDILSLNV